MKQIYSSNTKNKTKTMKINFSKNLQRKKNSRHKFLKFKNIKSILMKQMIKNNRFIENKKNKNRKSIQIGKVNKKLNRVNKKIINLIKK